MGSAFKTKNQPRQFCIRANVQMRDLLRALIQAIVGDYHLFVVVDSPDDFTPQMLDALQCVARMAAVIVAGRALYAGDTFAVTIFRYPVGQEA